MIRDINKSARLFHAKWTAPASAISRHDNLIRKMSSFRKELLIRLQQSRVDG